MCEQVYNTMRYGRSDIPAKEHYVDLAKTNWGVSRGLHPNLLWWPRSSICQDITVYSHCILASKINAKFNVGVVYSLTPGRLVRSGGGVTSQTRGPANSLGNYSSRRVRAIWLNRWAYFTRLFREHQKAHINLGLMWISGHYSQGLVRSCRSTTAKMCVMGGGDKQTNK